MQAWNMVDVLNDCVHPNASMTASKNYNALVTLAQTKYVHLWNKKRQLSPQHSSGSWKGTHLFASSHLPGISHLARFFVFPRWWRLRSRNRPVHLKSWRCHRPWDWKHDHVSDNQDWRMPWLAMLDMGFHKGKSGLLRWGVFLENKSWIWCFFLNIIRCTLCFLQNLCFRVEVGIQLKDDLGSFCTFHQDGEDFQVAKCVIKQTSQVLLACFCWTSNFPWT